MSDCKIYLDQPLPEEGTLPVRDDFSEHYLLTVRRLSPGDRVDVAGTNRVAEGILRGTDPVTVELESTRPVQSLQWDLHIYQAMTRKKKFEETIKRGTELGVTRFVPVITERTVRVPNNPEKQQRRWQKIATDSARISERDSLPTINKPQSFDDVLSSVSGTVYRAGPEGKSMEEVVKSDETQNTVSIFVGPEGGFTKGERNELDKTSAGTVRVGERNLRAETASVALITLWLGEKGYL